MGNALIKEYIFYIELWKSN